MIELPIYFHPEGDIDYEELGIDVPLSQCETRNVLFFNIDVVEPYKTDGLILGKIWSSSQSYLSTLSFDDVKRRIEEWKR